MDAPADNAPARHDSRADEIGAFDAFLVSTLRARFPALPLSPELRRLAEDMADRQH